MASRRSRSRSGGRRGITRIDQPSTRTHGFFARAGWHRRRDGTYAPKHRAFFGDVSHGGKRKALRAAMAWIAKVTAPPRKKARRKTGKAARRRAK
jgi:hypothetical protein